jgi:hypothetical protein
MLHTRDAWRGRHVRARQLFSSNSICNLLVRDRKQRHQEFSSNSLHGHCEVQDRISIHNLGPRNMLRASSCTLDFRT